MITDPVIQFTWAVTNWANTIAPDREAKDAVVKMVEETSELLDAVLNKDRDAVEEELGDCMILLADIADMYGIDLISAGYRKMAVNAKRTWTNNNGVIRRERGDGTDRQTSDGAGEAVSDQSYEPGTVGSGA